VLIALAVVDFAAAYSKASSERAATARRNAESLALAAPAATE